MPRVTTVKKARKAQGSCGRCGDALPKGSAYRWWKFRYGGKRKRCMKPSCAPRGSDLTSSDKLSRVYAAQENLEDAIAEWDRESVHDLQAAAEAAAEEIREVAQEYQDSADSIRESFSESPTADECEERAQELEDWADEIESAASDMEEFEGTKDCDECAGSGTVDCEECEHDPDQDPPCFKCTGDFLVECAYCDGGVVEDKDSWADEQQARVEDVAGSCPV